VYTYSWGNPNSNEKTNIQVLNCKLTVKSKINVLSSDWLKNYLVQRALSKDLIGKQILPSSSSNLESTSDSNPMFHPSKENPVFQ